MTKKCFLHLGLHKTASSSFQKTCSNNLEVLRTNNIIYPHFECSKANRSKIINHSIPIYSLFSGIQNYGVNVLWGINDLLDQVNASYLEQLINFLKTPANIIISGEDISMLSMNSLVKMLQLFKEYDFEIVPFALVRSPYSFFCSA